MGYLAVMTESRNMHRLDTFEVVVPGDEQAWSSCDEYFDAIEYKKCESYYGIFYIEARYGHGDIYDKAYWIKETVFIGELGSNVWLKPIKGLNIEAPTSFRFEETDFAESGLEYRALVTFEIRVVIENEGQHNESLRRVFATNIQSIKTINGDKEPVFGGEICRLNPDGSGGLVELDYRTLAMNPEIPRVLKFEKTDFAESGLRYKAPVTFEIRVVIENEGEDNEYIRGTFATNIRLSNVTN